MLTVAQDRLLRISEVMEVLQLTRASVLAWIDRGYLKEVRLPSGQRRIRMSEVERIVKGEGVVEDLVQIGEAARAAMLRVRNT